jgi:hypothetical protein
MDQLSQCLRLRGRLLLQHPVMRTPIALFIVSIRDQPTGNGSLVKRNECTRKLCFVQFIYPKTIKIDAVNSTKEACFIAINGGSHRIPANVRIYRGVPTFAYRLPWDVLCPLTISVICAWWS